MTALRPVIVVRSSVQNPATFPCNKRLFQCLSTASPVRPEWQQPHSTADARSATVGNIVLAPCRSLQQQPRSMRALSGILRTLPAFGHSIARRSLDEVPSSSDTIQQPFHPMIVRSDDLELVHQSLRTLEPPKRANFRASIRRTPNWGPYNLGT